METINLRIPNMKSAHCQLTVTNAVRAMGGRISSIAPINAQIELADGVTRENVIKAIQAAGYQVEN